MKIVTVKGGCSKLKKPVGFQFNSDGGKYYICGSFTVASGSSSSGEESLDGEFLYGQYSRGCKICGNKYVYQCCHCSAFNCYDGNAQTNAVCPVCGKKSNIPATSDKRIVRSSAGGGATEIVLAVDVSGSMGIKDNGKSTRLDEMKIAAIDSFVKKFDGVKMSLVIFGPGVKTVLPFTSDSDKMIRAINSLTVSGGTPSPLAHVYTSYQDYKTKTKGINKYFVVFTDGDWDSTDTSYAKKLKSNDVKIITIGCAGANMKFLRSIASDGASIEVSGNDFGSAYASAAKKISQ